jgi:hypothetical protein
MTRSRWFGRVLGGACLLAGMAGMPRAYAVPSFARQTGMACEACHTVFPELTHYGRMFKANGYTLGNLKQVRAIDSEKQELLALASLPPISAMVQISNTQLAKPLPDATGAEGHSQSGTVGFPQQISLFYAGKIAAHVGAFVQLTYSNASRAISVDNTDLRYADTFVVSDTQSLLYGVSLNNNPTVQDLWNSTPAFGFPYSSTNAGVSPLAAAQIDGRLAQDVAGLTAYVMWDEALYGEVGIYRSAKQGILNPITGAAGPLDGTTSNVLSGVAPYGRLAYERQWGRHALEIGAYGADFKFFPGGGNVATPTLLSGPVNQFQDVAEDIQYQFIGENQLLSVQATRIHESAHLDASYAAGVSANPSDDLTTTRVNATYYYRRRFGATLSRFSTSGSVDAGLYPAGAAPGVVTSANGGPDTRGWIAELDFLPWLNTKLTLQYTHYNEFNGGAHNYDGVGRNAADNNSIYAVAWVSF